jgi:hypothetical protein
LVEVENLGVSSRGALVNLERGSGSRLGSELDIEGSLARTRAWRDTTVDRSGRKVVIKAIAVVEPGDVAGSERLKLDEGNGDSSTLDTLGELRVQVVKSSALGGIVGGRPVGGRDGKDVRAGSGDRGGGCVGHRRRKSAGLAGVNHQVVVERLGGEAEDSNNLGREGSGEGGPATPYPGGCVGGGWVGWGRWVEGAGVVWETVVLFGKGKGDLYPSERANKADTEVAGKGGGLEAFSLEVARESGECGWGGAKALGEC